MERVTMAMKTIPKWMEESNMKNMVTRSTATESNAPIERLRVLKPPVAVTLIAWLIASNGLIPTIR